MTHIQNILNLVGKNSLLGHLIVTAQHLNMPFSLTSADNGQQYIASLGEYFEFGFGVRPEVLFCYSNEQTSERQIFDDSNNFLSLLLQISRTQQPICIFNHIGDEAWTYVFVLQNAHDLVVLFQHAQPNNYFMSNPQGDFMLAVNWHDFSFIQAA